MHWVGKGMNTREGPIPALYRRIELGDVLLFFYLLALGRQCFWAVTNNLAAWTLTCSLALCLSYFAFTGKEEPLQGERLSPSFYPIVALPLFVVYAARAVFPDFSFDVLNYHLVAAETSLRGWPYSPSAFLPGLNPLPDMITGIYRHLLGYRLGTVINYLTLIWVALILAKFLRRYFIRPWVRYLAILLILFTETLLFEVNNYMVDLLALPLLLEATYSVLHAKASRAIGYSQVNTAFLLGLCVALKLTNIFFVAPIILVWMWRLLAGRLRPRAVSLLCLSLVFVAPLIPSAVHLYRERSPIFPFFNRVVASPLGFTTLKEKRWGPIGLKQALVWPVLLYWQPQRVAELPVYAGKIPLGFVLGFCLLPFRRVDRNIRALGFIITLGALFWSLSSGYTRYAGYLEVVGGLLVIYLSQFVVRNLSIRHSLTRPLSLFPWGALATLSSFSAFYLDRQEWSLRPHVFREPQRYLRDAQFLLRDYSLRNFVRPEAAARLDDVEVWVRSVPLTSCFEALLKPDIPAIGLPQVLTLENKSKLDNAMRHAANKRMFSLTYAAQLASTADFIVEQGLGVGRITYLSIPYFSYQTAYDLALIEVLPSPGGQQRQSQLVGPLPAEAFTARLAWCNPPATLPIGATETLYVTVENASVVAWPGKGSTDGAYKVNLGNHWLTGDGRVLIMDDNRTPLPFELGPGRDIELPLTVKTPSTPGDYILEVDMVQEQVTWFGWAGSKTLRTNIKVQ